MSEQVTERKLTIKDLNTSYFMFEVFAQACCSYERLQAPGFFSGMKNVIAKLYTTLRNVQKPVSVIWSFITQNLRW